MFGFGRNKKPKGTASTIVEATGGGWHDAPQVVRVPRSGTEGDFGNIAKSGPIRCTKIRHDLFLSRKFNGHVHLVPIFEHAYFLHFRNEKNDTADTFCTKQSGDCVC